MNGVAVLLDGFGRLREVVHDALDGIGTSRLHARLDPDANTVAWLIWHLTRVQDDHVADATGAEQVWLAQGWQERFALPLPAEDTGFGHGREDVAAVRVGGPRDLLGYYDAVHEQTVGRLRELEDSALDEVVDDAWDPPVTRGVRLVSVIGDGLQHAGQAAFVRGVLERG